MSKILPPHKQNPKPKGEQGDLPANPKMPQTQIASTIASFNKKPNPAKYPKETRTMISVKCLPKTATMHMLYEYFRKFGPIELVDLDYPEGLSPSNGFAVVHFKHATSVRKACIQSDKAQKGFPGVQHHMLEGKIVKVQAINSKSEVLSNFNEMKHRRVYIRKLPNALDAPDLYKMFAQYGEIENAYCSFKSRKEMRPDQRKTQGNGLKSGYIIFKGFITRSLKYSSKTARG